MSWSDLYISEKDAPLLVPSHILKARTEAEEQDRRGRWEKKWGRMFSTMGRSVSSYAPGGADTKPSGTATWGNLRAMAQKSIIDGAILGCRLSQVRRVAQRSLSQKKAGFRVRHKRADDRDFELTDRIEERCREMEELVERVNKPVHTNVCDVMVMACEEELVVDRKAMVVFRDNRGLPHSYHFVDGTTVLPRYFVIFEEMRKQGWTDMDYAAARMSEQWGIDLTDAAYIQVVDGQIVAGWKEGEIEVDITNPTVQIDRWGFGKGSLLEQSLTLSESFLTAFMFNSERLNVSFPEMMMIVQGDFDQRSMEQFKQRLTAGAGKWGWWRMPVVPGGPTPADFDIKVLPLRNNNTDMQFMDWLIVLVNLKCAVFRMSPQLINIHPRMGAQPLIEHDKSATELISLSQEEGFHQVLENTGRFFTRTLIEPHYDDLVMVWEGLSVESDVQAEQRRTQQMQYRTVNEIRQEAGLSELPEEAATAIGDMIFSPYYFQAQQAGQMGGGMEGGGEEGQFPFMGAEGQGDEQQQPGGGPPQQPGQQQQMPPQMGRPGGGGPPGGGGGRPDLTRFLQGGGGPPQRKGGQPVSLRKSQRVLEV